MATNIDLYYYKKVKYYLKKLGGQVDICRVPDFETNAIGYNELRHIWLDEFDEPVFESQNINECNSDGEIDGVFQEFHFSDLTPSDRELAYVALREYARLEKKGKLLPE